MTGAARSADEPAATTEVSVALSSFGYKFGLPTDAEWMVDVRMVRNPFWVPELRPHTGLDAAVRDYVMADPVAVELVDRIHALLLWSASRYEDRGRDSLNVAMGCTGGRHRSVALVEALASRLRDDGLAVTIHHRDVDQPDPRYQ